MKKSQKSLHYVKYYHSSIVYLLERLIVFEGHEMVSIAALRQTHVMAGLATSIATLRWKLIFRSDSGTTAWTQGSV